MIDIHTHIIPALDDGPNDMETSIGMGRIAAQEGITAIISTSHSEESAALGREGASPTASFTSLLAMRLFLALTVCETAPATQPLIPEPGLEPGVKGI